MKKFSVLLVAILALMMLFVSCENEPEKRAATKDDGEIINGLIMSAFVVKADGITVIEKVIDDGVGTREFKIVEYKDPEDNVVAVLNGTISAKPAGESKTVTYSVDFGDGTKYKGVDHTLLANVVVKMPEKEVVSSEIILDGVIITDFDFDPIFKIMSAQP